MKKSKGQTVDLLYTSKEEKNKKKKNKKKSPKKKNAKKEKINLDNEIIIGLTPKKEKTTSKKNKKNKKKSQKNEVNKKDRTNEKVKKNKKEKTDAKKTITLKIIKWSTIFIIILLTIILFMMSSVFNIKEIEVINNSKVSKEEIINLSTLKLNNNMFKVANRTIQNSIKTNAYIENVKVKKSINGNITLEVIERQPTYMLKFANSYVYINNQGYMLETSENPLELPSITGFKTPSEKIKDGNRLIVEDLKKLEDIIKIMNSAKDKSFFNMITGIDISDSNNYKLTIASENKEVYFGDTTNINVKLLRIEEIIQKEKNVKGEIYFQNSEKTVFRETV